ncbi:unnamed protein product [Schistosoma margrebowiei]|uniref:Citrate transport protein n=1 Tax=Schistosoma margrebowiei TaxID=48269 RepID=A0A183LXP4_9TREM|nr:unnamed protein product [Schistosoma margrebowiei]
MGSARQYSGPIDCVKKTVGSYGFRGLYRGLPVLLYGSVPKSAVRFGAFEEFKRHNLSPDGTLTAGRKLLCGLGAGVCEAIMVVTPMETIKVKFINDQTSKNPHYRGFFHGCGCIVKEHDFVEIDCNCCAKYIRLSPPVFLFTTFGVAANRERRRVLFCGRRCGPGVEVPVGAVWCGEEASGGVSWRAALTVAGAVDGEKRWDARLLGGHRM